MSRDLDRNMVHQERLVLLRAALAADASPTELNEVITEIEIGLKQHAGEFGPLVVAGLEGARFALQRQWRSRRAQDDGR